MEGVAGIFSSRSNADSAVDGLRAVGFAPERIAFITPEVKDSELSRVPTTDAEEPGIGQAISGYLGGIIGASGGLALGTVVAGALLPGVGPVLAAGIATGALFGAGGAAAGTAIGGEMERTLDTGIPRDDLPFYKELLNEGRSVVIAFVDAKEMEEAASLVMRNNNAEDVSEVRKRFEARRTDAA